MHVIIMWFLNHIVFHMYSVACLSNYLLYRENVYIFSIDLSQCLSLPSATEFSKYVTCKWLPVNTDLLNNLISPKSPYSVRFFPQKITKKLQHFLYNYYRLMNVINFTVLLEEVLKFRLNKQKNFGFVF